MRVHLSFALYLLVGVLSGHPASAGGELLLPLLECAKYAGAALLLMAAGTAPLPNQKPSSRLAAVGCAMLWAYYGHFIWSYVWHPQAEAQMPVTLSHYVASCLLLAATASAVAALIASKDKKETGLAPPIDQPPRDCYPQRIAKLPGHDGPVRAVAFSPSRDFLATAGADARVRLWDFRGGNPQQRELPREGRTVVTALAFAPDNRTLAAGCDGPERIIHIWDLDGSGSGAPVQLAGRPSGKALAFSPDGALLATGGSGGVVGIWARTPHGWRKGPRYEAHCRKVLAAAFAPNGLLIATGGEEGTIRLCHVGRSWSRDYGVLTGHQGPVRTLAFGPDGDCLVSGGQDGSILLWELTAERIDLRMIRKGHSVPVRQVAVTPNGQVVMSVSEVGWVIRWERASGQMLNDFRLTESRLASTAITEDSRYLALGRADGIVTVYRLAAKRK